MRAMFHSRGASVDANPSPEARKAGEWTQQYVVDAHGATSPYAPFA